MTRIFPRHKKYRSIGIRVRFSIFWTPHKATINHVSDHTNGSFPSDQTSQLTSEHYQPLIALLQSQLAQASLPNSENRELDPQNTGIALPTNIFSFPAHNHKWFLNSGASCHISSTLHNFISHTPLPNKYVPNGLKFPISAIDIPVFRINLISFSALWIHYSSTITIYTVSFIIQDPQQLRMIGKSDLDKGLYILDTSKYIDAHTCKNVSVTHPNFCTSMS
ncbi:hypothetical protein CR513_31421, partial [Mucuna pruriens]